MFGSREQKWKGIRAKWPRIRTPVTHADWPTAATVHSNLASVLPSGELDGVFDTISLCENMTSDRSTQCMWSEEDRARVQSHVTWKHIVTFGQCAQTDIQTQCKRTTCKQPLNSIRASRLHGQTNELSYRRETARWTCHLKCCRLLQSLWTITFKSIAVGEWPCTLVVCNNNSSFLHRFRDIISYCHNVTRSRDAEQWPCQWRWRTYNM